MHGNSREDLFYLAGLFDGEGSIMIVRNEAASFMKNRIYPHYGVVIRIGMIDERSISLFKEVLGYGSVYKEKSYHHKRPMWRWTCRRNNEVKKFLQDLGPFLRYKYPQVVNAESFIERCSGALGKRITPEMNELQHKFYISHRALNGIESPATTERTGQRGRSKGLRLQATV